MGSPTAFAELAAAPEPRLDRLMLALAAEFRDVDADRALARLDTLGVELARAAGPAPHRPLDAALACTEVLGRAHGFIGEQRRYDAPENSMLDVVLMRRRGLPILLSVVYVEVARRARVALHGVGLAGHFVVGHFGSEPPVLLDPFNGGVRVEAAAAGGPVEPWGPHAIATRVLNNLVGSYERRGDVGSAILAAEMRLALPAPDPLGTAQRTELSALRSRLN